MSPSKNSYKDGYDDGNSGNSYDRNKFRDDDDYKEGLNDGRFDKKQNEEREKLESERENRDMEIDRISRAYTREFDPSSSTKNSYVPNPTVITVLYFIWMFLCIALFWYNM